MKRGLIGLVLFGALLPVRGQQLVPISMPDGRFVVWDQGRFEVLAEQAPAATYPGPGPLVLGNEAGELVAVQDDLRKVQVLQQQGADSVLRAGRNVAWRAGDSLKVFTGGRVQLLTPRSGRFTVGDSLVVFHDRADDRLKVWWRAAVHVVADVGRGAERPQWTNGSNTLLFHDRSAGRLFLFHRGLLKVLCDSCPNARVAAGGDLVAFVDGDDRFVVWDRGARQVVSEAPPRQFQAGQGLVGFTDLAGRLRLYRNGSVRTLTDTMPSMFTVRDSLMLYVERGQWRTELDGSPVTLSEHIPERWQVRGASVTWLDLDRGIRRYRQGKEEQLTRDGAYPWFEVHGGAVLYPGHRGERNVWHTGRTDVFY